MKSLQVDDPYYMESPDPEEEETKMAASSEPLSGGVEPLSSGVEEVRPVQSELSTSTGGGGGGEHKWCWCETIRVSAVAAVKQCSM